VPQEEDNASARSLEESLRVLDDYRRSELAGNAPRTVDAYVRVLRQVALWLAAMRDGEGLFHPEDLTEAAVAAYIGALRERDFSWGHLKRVLSVLNQFCNWLIARGTLPTNPTRGIAIGAQPPPGPRGLTGAQRSTLRRLVAQPASPGQEIARGRGGDPRGAAMFALGYWAGCSVGEISSLLVSHTHLEAGEGWLQIGGPRGRSREIPLRDEVVEALAKYLGSGRRFQTSAYLFTSQRETVPVPAGEVDGWRLGEAAIHEWWKGVKACADASEWPSIREVTFLDLRHDFEQRAQEAGWQREALAAYLGNTLRQGRRAGQQGVVEIPTRQGDLPTKLRLIKG
jgi:site-specific recombinase XerD